MEALLHFTDRDDPICKELETGNPLFLPHIHWLEGEKSTAALEGIWKDLLPKLRLAGISSLICVPLIAWREPQGMLLLASIDPDVVFAECDFFLAQSIGRSVGIAIQNAHLHEKAQHLTMRDPLTGVFNRRHFFEMVKDDLKRCQRYKTPLSIIMLDLDHFKRVNDTYGFAVGDQVLQVIARRCSQELRSMDKVARYGGSEFAILLPETPVEGARIAAERLCQRIADSSIEVQDALVFVTASLGVTGTDGSIANMDVETLLGQADQALFFAKQNGGKRVCAWQETLLGASDGFGRE
jgi:diguanylate cyclase (GGDEF)-like protein